MKQGQLCRISAVNKVAKTPLALGSNFILVTDFEIGTEGAGNESEGPWDRSCTGGIYDHLRRSLGREGPVSGAVGGVGTAVHLNAVSGGGIESVTGIASTPG